MKRNRLFLQFSFLGLFVILQNKCFGFDLEKKQVVQKLRKYCSACHALGELRFFWSEEDEIAWQDLFEKRSPKTNQTWKERIVATLTWPTEAPPPFEIPMNPEGDWMPKGVKRLEFAKEKIEEQSLRHFIISVLNSN